MNISRAEIQVLAAVLDRAPITLAEQLIIRRIVEQLVEAAPVEAPAPGAEPAAA